MNHRMRRTLALLVTGSLVVLLSGSQPAGQGSHDVVADLGVGAGAAVAQTTVVYSNYGAGDTYGTSALPIGIASQAHANYFVPRAPVQLESIEVTISTGFAGVPEPITFRLQADSAGLPGAIIESFVVTPAGPPSGTYRSPQTLTSVSRPLLDANVEYWLTASMTSGTGFWYNSLNGLGHTLDIVSRDNGATWGPSGFGLRPGPVFRINGSEPDGIAGLVDRVTALLQDGTLTVDQAQGLLDKLNAANTSGGAGATRTACNQLRAFSNQLTAFLRAGVLAAEEVDVLKEIVLTVRVDWGCVDQSPQ
jgi:hypothetical protein